MKLYNKGGPGLIIDSKYVIEGGRFSEHDTKKDRKHFDLETTIEVTDEYGEKLLRMYPKGMMQTDKVTISKKAVKKTKKRKK